ncbi:MAG: hypothetical protein JW738_04985 [Actinobacteria bacterium]|nr:hypothetical protein [Actinomycetota bacterium]
MSSDSSESGTSTLQAPEVTSVEKPDEKTGSTPLVEKLKKDWWKFLTLFIYCILLEMVISVHAPWHDELQAWLLARDTNPISLLFHYLRYEGHPGLWHLILMVPAKLDLPVELLNIIAGIAMAIAVYLILFRSPFPTIIKVLLPFSFFFFYQFAVISRSYSLIPLLLFLIAVVYNRKVERPLFFFTLLILLANVSLHGTLISLSLLCFYTFDLKKKWKSLSSSCRKKNIVGLAVFAVALILLIIMLYPPSDISSPAKWNFGILNFFQTIGEALNASLIISSHLYINIPLFLLLLPWLYKRRLLLTYLVMSIPLLVMFAVIHWQYWHFGILLVVLVFVLWLSFDEQHEENQRSFDLKRLPIKYIAVAALAVILVVQVAYSFNSFRAEHYSNYSSMKNIASFIKEKGLDDSKIYMLGLYTGINAYFEGNIFSNYNDGQPPGFWMYKKSNDHISVANEQNIEEAIRGNPDYILVSLRHMQEGELDIPGYVPQTVFYGNIIWAGKVFSYDSAVLYERE